MKILLKLAVALIVAICSNVQAGTLQLNLPSGSSWHVYAGIQGDGLDEVYLDGDFESGLVTIDFSSASDQAWNNGIDVQIVPTSGPGSSSSFGIGAAAGMSKELNYSMSFGSPGTIAPVTSDSPGLISFVSAIPSKVQVFFVGATTLILAFNATIYVLRFARRGLRQ